MSRWKYHKDIKEHASSMLTETDYSDTQKLVDPLGYIPHNVKVENYISAGIKLSKARIEQYDADSKVKPEDIPHNPFRDIGTDFADVDRSKKMLEKRIKAQIERQRKAYERENERVKSLEKALDKKPVKVNKTGSETDEKDT